MKYSETKRNKTFELEILNDGVRYSRKSKDENSSNFIPFENIGDGTSCYDLNTSSWANSYYYKYFIVVAVGFGIFSFITTGKIAAIALLFLFVAFVFWALTFIGNEKTINLENVGYGSTITWFNTKDTIQMFDEIRNKRNEYLKQKYLNDDGSLKEIIQNESIIRNMSLFGLADNNLVSKIEDHNKRIYEERMKAGTINT